MTLSEKAFIAPLPGNALTCHIMFLPEGNLEVRNLSKSICIERAGESLTPLN
jgi:hypothetical protein